MRLNRYVQVAVGLVAGGSVVIVLSGSALAAGNSQDTVIQDGQVRPVSSTNTGHHQNALSPVGPLNTDNQQPGDGQDQPTISDQSDPSLSSGDTANGVTVANNGNNGDSNSGQVTDQTVETNTGQQVSTNTVPAKAKSDGGGGMSATTGGSGQLVPVNDAAVTSAATPAEVAVVAPGNISSAAPADHATLLRIQPVITNRAVEAQDLAATVPTAPAPARAPNPAKSSGLLGSLVVGLAGVVVPQPLVPSADIAYRVMLAASLATMVVLLINVFLFTYGLWLRRGGFVTAARSDAPSRRVTSSFATPLLLGYVTSPPDLHNPILMVAETNILNQNVRTAFRKEDMR